ncbi:acyl-CoA dehydrogenase family protein [Streptomyces sp. BPTC-684]|uniref:acyl-CoA dehydrogenase family protein n=1 Tax=Streptomyces sp. BPTC-684 TaxID=3043734 RepID=UPI0024B16796|nr:acyl-CoA dehydrogenase family protein [Streptomyces sp. BPTC-684]WHM41053.1 acyl-CoA dehydrogenase family protein [Streptomyces sp. BPTC-684]
MTIALPEDDLIHAERGHAYWLHIAREMADDLATDAALREQVGEAPLDEVSRLREAGLLTLLAPAGHGGGGADWRTAYAVVRTISAADGAIGHLLGRHYFLSVGARFFAAPALAARVEQESAVGRWCWGGGFASHEPPLTLTSTANGYVLDGSRIYASAAMVADRLAVCAARLDTGEPLAVFVDSAHPGVVCGSDGDAFGQRLAGGSVRFDSVPVPADQVLGSLSSDEGVLSPFAALAVPTARLFSVQFCLGVAEGLVAEAREYRRAAHSRRQPSPQRPWPGTPPQDPYALTAYGELTVAARSASALADQAVEALTRGLARGEDIDDDECAEITVLASAAEAAASRAAQEITTHALDVIGADAASSRHGFDRFWRNARTHTLREPVAPRLREVGDYYLNGTHPPFALPA